MKSTHAHLGPLLAAFLTMCGSAPAQVDLTGIWSPVFHEDQPERIPGPDAGGLSRDSRSTTRLANGR